MSDRYADIAVELHELADTFARLAGRGLHAPTGLGAYVSLLLSVSKSDAPRTVPTVDAIAAALGVTPTLKALDRHHGEYAAVREGDAVRVIVRCYAEPPADPRDVEIARLRAELDANNSRAATAVPQPTGGSPQVRDQSPGSGPGQDSARASTPAERVTAPMPGSASPNARTTTPASLLSGEGERGRRGPGLDAGDGQGTRPAGVGGDVPAPATRGHPCIDVPPGVRVLGDPDYGQTKRTS